MYEPPVNVSIFHTIWTTYVSLVPTLHDLRNLQNGNWLQYVPRIENYNTQRNLYVGTGGTYLYVVTRLFDKKHFECDYHSKLSTDLNYYLLTCIVYGL